MLKNRACLSRLDRGDDEPSVSSLHELARRRETPLNTDDFWHVV